MRRATLTAIPAALLIASAGLLAGFARHPGASPAPAAAAADSYQVDPVHSTVLFQIRHSGITNFYGRFNDFAGEFTFDPESPSAAEFSFEVQTASVDTGNQKRDDHLRNADFFNARQFPTVTFKSTGLEHVEGDTYKLTGELTLQGETRPVTADFQWLGTATGPTGAQIAAYEARFEIKRSDFGMSKYLSPDGGEGGGIGNTVKLVVSVEAAKK
ncbi:MAG TPA: YceI family protein [Phycisphaerales bacterium]|nr:YceI family protein [Phycisphaerales bacterium]